MKAKVVNLASLAVITWKGHVTHMHVSCHTYECVRHWHVANTCWQGGGTSDRTGKGRWYHLGSWTFLMERNNLICWEKIPFYIEIHIITTSLLSGGHGDVTVPFHDITAWHRNVAASFLRFPAISPPLSGSRAFFSEEPVVFWEVKAWEIKARITLSLSSRMYW